MVAKAIPLILAGASVVQGVQSFMAADAAGDAAQQATAFETQQLELQVSRERTQAALEAQEREDRLKRALSAQRAAFGGAGVDASSGSALRLQETTIGSINREQSISDFNTSQNILNLNVQGEQAKIAGVAAQNRANAQKVSAITGTISGAASSGVGGSLISGYGGETWANGDSFR